MTAGSEVELVGERPESAAKPDPTLPLTVRFEDETLLIVDKPAGVPSHPLSPGELGTLANALLARYPEMLHVGYDARQAGLVNRLDTDTSGLVLVAKTRLSFERLRAMVESGSVHKRYLALTTNPVTPQELTYPLVPRGPRVGLARAGEKSRAATTRVVRCEPFARGHYLVEAEAPRAYRHQVRAHLALAGAPLLGDVLYGGAPAKHHHLHAARIAFRHPFTDAEIAVESPLPAEWPRER